MSASDEWAEYHLIPTGWVKGSEQWDGGKKAVAPPTNRLLTQRRRAYMSSGFSEVQHTLDEIWRGTDAAAIDVALKQFGECPKSY